MFKKCHVSIGGLLLSVLAFVSVALFARNVQAEIVLKNFVNQYEYKIEGCDFDSLVQKVLQVKRNKEGKFVFSLLHQTEGLSIAVTQPCALQYLKKEIERLSGATHRWYKSYKLIFADRRAARLKLYRYNCGEYIYSEILFYYSVVIDTGYTAEKEILDRLDEIFCAESITFTGKLGFEVTFELQPTDYSHLS